MTDPKPQSSPAPRGQNLQLTIEDAEGQGIYANLALITHSNSEVILDFARMLPGLQKAKVHARVILTPPNAKALHRALGENLSKFEAQHGPIQGAGEAADAGKAIGFNSP